MAFDPTELFACSWGDIQLFASAIRWDAGETQVVHDLAAGDLHPIQRRGSHLRKATVQLMFDDINGVAESGISAFRRFQASTKERRIFTHPMDGSFFAVVGQLTPEMDEHSVVRASCEFLPDSVVPPVAPSGAGSTSVSGESSVAAAADEVAKTLSEQGLGFPPDKLRKLDFSKSISVSINLAFSVDAGIAFSANVSAETTSSVSATASASASAGIRARATAGGLGFSSVYNAGLAAAKVSSVAQTSGMASPNAFAFALAAAALDTDARSSVASWTDDETISTRQIIIDATRLSESLTMMIEVGGFELDIDLWPAFRSAILLGESIRSAVLAATSETASVFIMRVQRSTSLLPLCAKIYGGFEAQQRARQIASLNDIRTPGWLDPGDYLMPAKPASSQSAFQGDE